MKKRFFGGLMFSTVLALSSCHTDDLHLDRIKGPSVSTAIAVKLGSTEYTVAELLADLDDETISIETAPDNTISLHFTQSTVFDNIDELMTINSVSNSEEFAPGENVPAAPIGYSIAIDQVFTFTFPTNGGEQIDSLFFNAGTFDYNMRSTFKGDVDYTWVVEGLKYVTNGENLTRSKLATYAGGEVTDSYSRSLEGLKSVMYKNATGDNEFKVKVTGTITFEAGVEIVPTDKITFDLAYNNPGFSALYGYFGNKSIDLQNQSIDMAAFEEFSGKGLKLEDPTIYLIAKNGFGLDIGLDFKEVKAISADNNELLLVEKNPPGIDNVLTSPRKVGGVKVDTVTLNKQNSNIDDLLNATPVRMDFTIAGILNPPASTRTSNFLAPGSQIEVISEIVIPLRFQMDGFAVDFEFDMDVNDLEDIQSLQINLLATNEIPFSGAIDLIFLNEQGGVLLTELGVMSFDSPIVGSNGKVSAPGISTSTKELTQNALDAILEAKKIRAVANFSTFEANKDRYVTLYSDYRLKVELSILGELTVNAN